ncbi:MAG: hypothetical protein IJ799_05685, partial [Bacteroidales bacterium]|nr:hypothetical protein [Bacteroidales bacterium]
MSLLRTSADENDSAPKRILLSTFLDEVEHSFENLPIPTVDDFRQELYRNLQRRVCDPNVKNFF